MITKVQGKTLAGEIAVSKEPQLSSMERAMLKWAVVDPDDKVLDANVGVGKMAEYLRRNMQCEVCGVSDNMEHVRFARSRLQNCDIIYAPQGDIPWREDSFDTVLMRVGNEETEIVSRMLSEANRVLKPGGQLILGAVCYPMWINVVADWFSVEEKNRMDSRRLEKLIEEQKLESPSWQRTTLGMGVMIAWKHKEDLRKKLTSE